MTNSLNKKKLTIWSSVGLIVVAIMAYFFFFSGAKGENNLQNLKTVNVEQKNVALPSKFSYVNLKPINIKDMIYRDKITMLLSKPVDEIDLVNVYEHKIVKSFKVTDLNFNINKDIIENTRLRLLGKKNHSYYNIIPPFEGMVKKTNDYFINNNGLEVQKNKLTINWKKEGDIFANELNSYRKRNNLPQLIRIAKIDALSQNRVKSEVKDKKYNFHYTSDSGFANRALIKALSENDCGLTANLKIKTWCNFKFKDYSVNVRTNNNDFEQVTKGLIFGIDNFNSLLKSPLHKKDFDNKNKKYFGLAIYGNINQDIKPIDIIVYGPLNDHNLGQASSAYIKNNPENGIKIPEEQEQVSMRLYNVSLSFYGI